MKITADTNILLRAIADDHPTQSAAAMAALATAEVVALSLSALCELVWVLRHSYKRRPADIAETLRQLIGTQNVVVQRAAVAAGLAHLDMGGDFADGVIAYEGEWLGAETFASFDRKAVERVLAHGRQARLLT